MGSGVKERLTQGMYSTDKHSDCLLGLEDFFGYWWLIMNKWHNIYTPKRRMKQTPHDVSLCKGSPIPFPSLLDLAPWAQKARSGRSDGVPRDIRLSNGITSNPRVQTHALHPPAENAEHTLPAWPPDSHSAPSGAHARARDTHGNHQPSSWGYPRLDLDAMCAPGYPMISFYVISFLLYLTLLCLFYFFSSSLFPFRLLIADLEPRPSETARQAASMARLRHFSHPRERPDRTWAPPAWEAGTQYLPR